MVEKVARGGMGRSPGYDSSVVIARESGRSSNDFEVGVYWMLRFRGPDASEFRPVHRRHVVGDQPRAALERQIIPEPFECDHQPMARSDQKINVDDAPEQPAEEAAQAEPADRHDGGAPADGGE